MILSDFYVFIGLGGHDNVESAQAHYTFIECNNAFICCAIYIIWFMFVWRLKYTILTQTGFKFSLYTLHWI